MIKKRKEIKQKKKKSNKKKRGKKIEEENEGSFRNKYALSIVL